MFDVEQTIFVERSPQAVFDMIVEPENVVKWGTSETAEWVTDGPTGVGSRRRSTGKFLGRNIDTVFEVTRWEPPHRFDIKTVGGPIDAQLHHTIETQEGGSQLTVKGMVDLSGFLRIAEPLLKRQTDRQMAADIGAVKLVLEAEES